MKILHIHQDFPDGLPYPYTKAVSNLIDASRLKDESIEHYVVSVNRTSNPLKIKIQPFEEGISIVYWCIPLPYLYVLTMWVSSWFLYLVVRKLRFDLIHGHKLTSEGVFTFFLSKKMGLPYVLSIRGGSDCHNLTRFPQHEKYFAKIFRGAATVFWVSEWAKKRIEGLFGNSLAKSVSLPNICMINLNSFSNLKKNKPSRYICAISFHQYKRKGVIQLIEAIAILKRQGVEIYLDIFGGGEAKAKSIVQASILKEKLSNNIRLRGKISQKDLLRELSCCRGFLMPSINETFGMTYIEALSVGCPILYMKNTGIDGYFDSYNVGVALENQSSEEIVMGIKHMDKNFKSIKVDVLSMVDSGYLNSFTGKCVAAKYLASLKRYNQCLPIN